MCSDMVFDPFMEAEQCINLTLPSWLKKMLVINGYNNSKVIGSIDDKDMLTSKNLVVQLCLISLKVVNMVNIMVFLKII